jgi:hypothetical protein
MKFSGYSYIVGTELYWLFKGKLPKEVLFIPDAYNGPNLNQYLTMVGQVFTSLNIQVRNIHDGNPADLLEKAACVVIGGGSLEKLLKALQNYKSALVSILENRVPCFAWNEGAVLLCPYYVVPDPIPGYPAGLDVTRFQFYFNFPDDAQGINRARTFLLNHTATTPAIHEIAGMVNRPGGTGVRLEDDNVAIDFGGNSPVDPRIIIKPGTQ